MAHGLIIIDMQSSLGAFLQLNHCGQREFAAFSDPGDLGCLVYVSSDARKLALPVLAKRSPVAKALLERHVGDVASDDEFPWFSCTEALIHLEALDLAYLKREATRIAREAAACGRISVLDYLYQGPRFIHWLDVCRTAAAFGRTNVFEYCHSRGLLPEDDRLSLLTEIATKEGQLDVLRFVLSIMPDDRLRDSLFQLVILAARKAQPHIVEYILSMRDQQFWGGVAHLVAVAAIESKSVACLKLIVESGCPLRMDKLIMPACGSGTLDCLRFLWDRGARDMDFVVLRIAIENGFADIADFLVRQGHNLEFFKGLHNRLLVACAMQLPIVRYLHEHGFAMTAEMFGEAVISYATTDVIKFLCEHGYPMKPGILEKGIVCRPIEVYKICIAHGYRFDARKALANLLPSHAAHVRTKEYEECMTYLHELAEEAQRVERYQG